MTRRYALILTGAWLAVCGLAQIGTRSLLRVWVDSQRDRWVIPYEGELLLLAAAAFTGAGIIISAFVMNCRDDGKADEAFVRAGILLLTAAALGLCVAGACQAGLHVARLAIPGGSLHPRSLVGSCLAFAVAGAALLARGTALARPPGPGRG
ncbi:MAG: hypothetical protein KatS3mg024_1533 [Armatimonadota bacterium]|nr:MAG: hypothetical protein KatS3mg024_1533 [Armatimonadota bacterium]